jgi:hypothetical protein
MRLRRTSPTGGVESNARLTATTAVVLLVLLAAEGLTLLGIRRLLTVHVFVGMLLVPPILLKIGSTGWRFVRYYRGEPAYRRKGPPPTILRLLGPVVVILTVVMMASGVGLIGLPRSFRHSLLFVHKASFVLWFGAMTVHVLGHVVDTARLAPLDFARRTRDQVAHAGARTWALSLSLVAGLMLGIATWGHTGGFEHVVHLGR